MNRHLIRLVLLCIALALAACGDDVIPSPQFDPASGSQLSALQAVKIRFGEDMDPATLVLGEGMGTQATATWSTTEYTNDTLTLSPPASGWVGQPGVTVQVSSHLGVPQALLNARFEVVTRLSTFRAASVVIGQANFAEYRGILSASTLSSPEGNPAIGPDGQFFLTDTANHRLLGFSQLPTTNNASADWVQGQPNFNTSNQGVGPLAFSRPTSVAIHGQALAMADSSNSRVLIWNALPTTVGTPPDVVLGQPDLSSRSGACGPAQLDNPKGVAFAPDGQLIVADSGNHRVLVWDSLPTSHGQPPDLVLGQSDFSHCASNDDDQDGVWNASPTARTLDSPSSVWTDGTRLVISDELNNRVLVWNTFPTSHFQPADIVLGQSGFTQSTRNDDNQDGTSDATPSARTLYNPVAVAGNGVQLAVSDFENNRVLIWNHMPTASFQPADVVLGQSNFTNSQYDDTNQDGVMDPTPSAYTTSGPSGLLFHGNRLIVVQDAHGGNRVIVFKGL